MLSISSAGITKACQYERERFPKYVALSGTLHCKRLGEVRYLLLPGWLFRCKQTGHCQLLLGVDLQHTALKIRRLNVEQQTLPP
jgi:hypothetical protein